MSNVLNPMVALRLCPYCKNWNSGLRNTCFHCGSDISDVPLDDNDEEKKANGVVYLIQSGKHFKIGRAIDGHRRFKQLKIQLPEKAVLLHEITTNNVLWAEKHWHKRFESKRMNGEWFRLSNEDVAEFRACQRIETE